MRLTIPFLIAFASSILLGCSGSTDPVTPAPSTDIPVPRSAFSSPMASTVALADPSEGLMLDSFAGPHQIGGHEIMGIWTVRLWDDGRMDVYPRRIAGAHINVTSMILNCPTCFTIELGPPPGPNMFEFNVTLTNPTGITGYDVTGVIRSSGDIRLLNPDSYTFLFSYPFDTIPNPYAAWDTGVGNRRFSGHASHTETLQFEKGGITKFGEIDFIFQASWPDNQEEPYGIWELLADGEFDTAGANSVELRCRVGDWQGNIDSVLIDLTPLGGAPNTPMTFLEDNIWTISNVSYSPSGQGAGDHRLKVTATSNGVSTYNYIPVTVVSSGPIKQGPFEVVYQNLPLDEPDGPADGMDIAVMGAQDGSHVGMVFGGDDTYHFWSPDYQDGTFGLYHGQTGDPIEPFDLPNYRFDFSDTSIPDSSVDSIFTLSWGEANMSTEILDAASNPQVVARQRIALWYLNGESLKLTANVLVIGANPGPPPTYDVIVRPIEFASGFREDGLLYMALAFDSGDEAQFTVVDIMALTPPLDFNDNPNLYTGGYEIPLTQGSGTGFINRQALVGMDVDDSNVLQITGGYAGHAWVAVTEAVPENVLEIIDADIEAQDNTFITVPLPAIPLDVEILPLKDVGQASNAICVLCQNNSIYIYNYSGALLYTIGGPPYMIGNALRLDIDDKNLAIHVLHQGTPGPLVTVYQWDG